MIKTTQNAPLEKLLSILRYKRTIKYIYKKKVLDFGCGVSQWNTKSILKYPKLIHGVDKSFNNNKDIKNNLPIFCDLSKLPLSDYNVVLAMAVFEHIDPFKLVELLDQIFKKTSKDAIIFGTTPTPYAKPILEFLSYKLNLIDQSQIKDHKIYYDKLWLNQILSRTNWVLQDYKKFQFGLNSEFVLSKF